MLEELPSAHNLREPAGEGFECGDLVQVAAAHEPYFRRVTEHDIAAIKGSRNDAVDGDVFWALHYARRHVPLELLLAHLMSFVRPMRLEYLASFQVPGYPSKHTPFAGNFLILRAMFRLNPLPHDYDRRDQNVALFSLTFHMRLVAYEYPYEKDPCAVPSAPGAFSLRFDQRPNIVQVRYWYVSSFQQYGAFFFRVRRNDCLKFLPFIQKLHRAGVIPVA